MPRPCKRRRVRGRPNSSYFKPAGIPINSLEESILTIDESKDEAEDENESEIKTITKPITIN